MRWSCCITAAVATALLLSVGLADAAEVTLISVGGVKQALDKVIADYSNELGAFTVVRAASHEAAAKMFENHPHFAIFPGEAVEIMPVLPIPGG